MDSALYKVMLVSLRSLEEILSRLLGQNGRAVGCVKVYCMTLCILNLQRTCEGTRYQPA